jgi:hypothetical protein
VRLIRSGPTAWPVTGSQNRGIVRQLAEPKGEPHLKRGPAMVVHRLQSKHRQRDGADSGFGFRRLHGDGAADLFE